MIQDVNRDLSLLILPGTVLLPGRNIKVKLSTKAGLFIIALATYFYMGSAFGAGPRDSLMVGLKRKTGLPIGLCRSLLEVTSALIGWKMGGLLGVGTIMAAFLTGFCIQITFKALKFDTTSIKHETILDTYRNIMEKQTTETSKSACK